MELVIKCVGVSKYSKYFNEYNEIRLGFFRFLLFRIELAKRIDENLGSLYEKWINSILPWTGNEELANNEFKDMQRIAKSTFKLLTQSGNKGSISYEDAKLIYEEIKELNFSYPVKTMGDNRKIDLFEALKDLLQYSWKKRRAIYIYSSVEEEGIDNISYLRIEGDDPYWGRRGE